MASGFWAFFRERTVPAATDAWIRRGHFSGATWAWDTAQIPFPDKAQAYGSYAHYGYLKVDPYASTLLWVGTFVLVAGALRLRLYLYDVAANTWTLKLDVPYSSGPALWICDMAFDSSGGHLYTWAAVATDGAIGGAGVSPGQGVYVSVDRGTFTFVGSGLDASHHYAAANVNAPRSLTALMAAGSGGSLTLYSGHNVTEAFAGSPVWVVSESIDGGATWQDDPFTPFSGNRFMLEAFTVLNPITGTTALWYCASHSPTGAYFPSSEGVVPYTPGGGWGGFGNPTPAAGSIAYPFPSAAGRGVAFPTGGTGVDQFGYTTDGGANWNSVAAQIGGNRFWYRAGRVSGTSLDAAGVTLSGGTSSCYLMWTEDGGVTWHSAVVESNADGLSLDVGDYVPPNPHVNLEVLTFRDSRMFYGTTRYYVASDSDVEAIANALGIADALQLLTDGAWTGATGPYNTPPGVPTPGSDAIYQNIEMIIRLVWITEDGVAIMVEVPAPATALFISDQESISLLNPDLADAAAAGLTYKLCTRGGQLAVSFIGATRIMRGFRSTETIRTLDPNETNTAE